MFFQRCALQIVELHDEIMTTICDSSNNFYVEISNGLLVTFCVYCHYYHYTQLAWAVCNKSNVL